jgi:nitronate monooxygenase
MWTDRRILELFGIELPIIQAPMAGPCFADIAIAVSEAGGLGSLPTATLSPEEARSELQIIRQQTGRPFNVNFFCHREPASNPLIEAGWRKVLATYYREFGLDPNRSNAPDDRAPFNDALCRLVEEFRPVVVSFHFGLPAKSLLDRVRAAGARVISSATTVAEARWLEDQGCDAIIAQGAEAGGHRGIFLSDDVLGDAARQPGTFALVPQVVDAVKVPVIAAGGIADGRGVVAALALGASAVQVGTAYLFTPEARISAAHRAALMAASADATALTNVFTGRPARGIVNRVMREVGPISRAAPTFPTAGGALAPLKKAAPGDFGSLWSGQAGALARQRNLSAGELTRSLAAEARQLLDSLLRTRP